MQTAGNSEKSLRARGRNPSLHIILADHAVVPEPEIAPVENELADHIHGIYLLFGIFCDPKDYGLHFEIKPRFRGE